MYSLQLNVYCIAVCPKLAILNETSGVITSPFYPRRYLANQRCSWKISARKGKRIILVIEDMAIGWWYPTCRYGYLEIKNDSYSSTSSSGRMCGYLHGNVFSSVENLIVLFVSWYSRNRGFKATYHQVNSHNVSTGKKSKQFYYLSQCVLEVLTVTKLGFT